MAPAGRLDIALHAVRADRRRNGCTVCVATCVATCRDKYPEAQPVTLVGHLILQQVDGAIAIDHQQIQTPIVIDITHRQATARVAQRQGGPAAGLNFFETAIR